MNTPTPETDAESFSTVYQGNLVYADFAKKLERERDNLQKTVDGLCEHFHITPANSTLLVVELLRMKREVDRRERLQLIVDEGCRASSLCREYREQRDKMAEILRGILAYDKGDKPHDYWALENHGQANAMAFDAWQEILYKIEQALETKP